MLAPFRVPVLALLALLALLPAAVLGWQLHAETAAHRHSAASMLNACARLAAEDYARRVALTVDVGILMPAMRVFDGADGGPEDRAMRIFRERFVETMFRFDPTGPKVELDQAIQGLDPEWLARQVSAILGATQEATYGATLDVVHDGSTHRVIGLIRPRRAQPAQGGTVPTAARGFLGSCKMLRDLLEAAQHMGAELLAPLVERNGGEALVAIDVRDREGRRLFGSPARDEERSVLSDTTLPARHGGLGVEARLRHDAAASVLIGGIPRARYLEISLLLLAGVVPLLGVVYIARRQHELAALRGAFVASVSHELRTPLAQIRLFAETLRLGRVRTDDERTRSLDILDQEARRLHDLVENILSFSRLERQTFRVQPVRCDVHALVEECVEWFGPIAAARHNAIEIAWVDAGRDPVDVDPAAFRMILTNLLDNAVKYGASPQTIRVCGARSAGRLVVSVDDEGGGVPRADRTRVFERFWRRADAAITGAGIGLCVVRELVELHGGEVSVGDAPGGGARISVELPA